MTYDDILWARAEFLRASAKKSSLKPELTILASQTHLDELFTDMAITFEIVDGGKVSIRDALHALYDGGMLPVILGMPIELTTSGWCIRDKEGNTITRHRDPSRDPENTRDKKL